MEQINIHLQKRKKFGEFIEIFRPQIEEEIDDIISNINLLPYGVSAKFGGNAWNYHFSKYSEELSELEQSCVTKGNFDVFCLFIDPYIYNSKIYKNIVKRIHYLYKLIKSTLPEEYQKYYQITFGHDSNKTTRTISPNSEIYFINIETLDGVTIPEEYQIMKGDYDINNASGIVYFEIGTLTFPDNDKKSMSSSSISSNNLFSINSSSQFSVIPSNISVPSYDSRASDTTIPFDESSSLSKNLFESNQLYPFKEFILESGSHYKKENTKTNNTMISLIGLFYFSMFLDSAKREKGLSVDEIRNYLFKKYKQNDLIDYLRQQTLEATIVQLTFVLMPNIFGNNGFYRDKQTAIMNRCFELYGATIETDNNDTISYTKWFDKFNSDVFLDSAGGGNGIDFLPSLRQLIEWFAICIQQNEPTVHIEGSGGDAIRHYLPETITMTADIDTKLFFVSKDKIVMPNCKNRMIRVLFILLEFLYEYNYFRFKKTATVRFGDNRFILTMTSMKQEIISRLRVMPYYSVPLISIDARCKMQISPITNKENSVLTSWYYNFAPLDIAFISSKATFVKNKRELATKQNIVSFSELNNDETIMAYPVTTISNKKRKNTIQPITKNLFYSMPEPTLDFIIADVEKLLTPPYSEQRKIAGKHEKDKLRMKLLMELKENNKELISESVSIQLDQMHTIKSNSLQDDCAKEIIKMFHTIYLAKTYKDIEKYLSSITWLFNPNNPYLGETKLFLNSNTLLKICERFIKRILISNQSKFTTSYSKSIFVDNDKFIEEFIPLNPIVLNEISPMSMSSSRKTHKYSVKNSNSNYSLSKTRKRQNSNSNSNSMESISSLSYKNPTKKHKN